MTLFLLKFFFPNSHKFKTKISVPIIILVFLISTNIYLKSKEIPVIIFYYDDFCFCFYALPKNS